MSEAKKKVPAIEGWFVADGELAHLIGSKCNGCGSYFFPKETFFCRNPACRSNDFEQLPLSRTGKLWSFTDNRYPPPAPYVAPDPFVPYIVAAVELDREKMVVLGQVSPGVSIGDLAAGMAMELVIDTLYEDDENEYLVWKWRPSAG
jgi:uncharacterized OB-fold protein